MKIAYFSYYVGKEFTKRHCKGKQYALSGTLKSQGIARALMAVGNSVVIYSPGVLSCGARIPAFSEVESYPEGNLTIKYPRVFSYTGCSIINIQLIRRLIARDLNHESYDAFVYYNIESGSYALIDLFKNSLRVLEYEDNIFNQPYESRFSKLNLWWRKVIFKYVMSKTDAALVVCNGMVNQLNNIPSALTPGIINNDVTNNITQKQNNITDKPYVNLVLTGGLFYGKGADLLIKAMSYINIPCKVELFSNEPLPAELAHDIEMVPKQHVININGYLPHEELIKFLDNNADILINTTRNLKVEAQAAGFPFKMMEYASTGRPIVSSEIGKLDDEYNSHITYYESEDPKSIAAAIEEVIQNYNTKVQEALKLQKRVLVEYTIEGTGKKLNSFFKKIQTDEYKK